MAQLYDSVTVAAIPADARAVASYVDGDATWPALVARFPRALRYPIYTDHATPITAVGPGRSVILDVEHGNPNTPDQVVEWVRAQRVANRVPIVYTNLSSWSGLAANFGTVRPPLWWVAGWTGHAYTMRGATGVQYAAPGNGSPGDFDLSELTGRWPGLIGGTMYWLDKARISSLLRQAAAIMGEVIAIGNQAHLPNTVRGVLSGIGGLILWEEHKIQGWKPPK